MDRGFVEEMAQLRAGDERLRDAISKMAGAKRHLDNALGMQLRAGVEGAGRQEMDRIEMVVRFATAELLIAVSWTLIVAGETTP